MWTRSLWLVLATLTFGLGGCGDDGKVVTGGELTGGSGGATGGGGVAGSVGATGGTSAAGAAGTSTGGTSTGGGPSIPGLCSPVQKVNPPQQECPGWDTVYVGVPRTEANVFVTSVELPTTMVATVEYAFSLTTTSGEADIKLVGTDADCGKSHEEMGPWVHVKPGTKCWSMLPNSPHSRLLIVRRNAGSHVLGELTTCALGSCD